MEFEKAPISAEQRASVLAAQRVLRDGLLGGRSTFAPELMIWTPEVAGELRRMFVERPDESHDDFLTKLKRQLDGARDETIVLAAELMYLNMVPLSARQLGKKAKLELVIEPTLSWSSMPVSVPEDLVSAATGFMTGGPAFLNYRPFQIQFLVLLTERLVGMSAGERAACLADPWRFRDECYLALDAQGSQRARAQLHMLLYLMFPDTFIPSSSLDHKRRIHAAFQQHVPAAERTGDTDRELLAIEAALEQQAGGYVSFYDSPWYEMWNPADDGDSPSMHGWLVRGANVDSHNLIDAWLREGFCSVQWPDLPETLAGASRNEVKAAVETAYPDRTSDEKTSDWRQLYDFLTRMQDGDLVVTVDGDVVHVGTVRGDAFHNASGGARTIWRRPVEWRTKDAPLSRAALSDDVRRKLKQPRTVNDVTAVAAELADAAGLSEQVGDALAGADETVPVEVPGATPEFAASLLYPEDWVERTFAVLKSKKQMILYGPPGTGKTHLARKLAEHVAQPENVQLIQFHPSYTYEDFFEGFRPRSGKDGTVTFELVDGPLKTIAKHAKEQPAVPHVLIIDEINRANLAKVFGELYFLLEYRSESITTQYRPEATFDLPHNLFFIGTMNTADRSIALVDAALRRRFAFRRLSPDTAPVRGLLRRWLAGQGLDTEPADLLDELNSRLGDPDRMIGPSFLMTHRVDQQDVLDLVWETEILPLLEDQLHGTNVDVADEYGLTALRAATSQSNRSALDTEL